MLAPCKAVVPRWRPFVLNGSPWTLTGTAPLLGLPRYASSTPGAAAANPHAAEESSITSTANPYVKHLVKLRERLRYRREQGRLLLVGATIVRELAECTQLRVATLLLQPGAPWPLPGPLQPGRVVWISEPVARKISGLEAVAPDDAIVELDVSGQGPAPLADLRAAFGLPLRAAGPAGVAAATERGEEQRAGAQPLGDAQAPPRGLGSGEQRRHAAAPEGSQQASPLQNGPAAPRQLRRVLALEAVQDPGNLGTLLRCAMAFGWDAVVLLPGCCDPFNAKALRASRGAALRLPLAEGGWEELSALASDAGLALLAAKPEEGVGDSGGGESGIGGFRGGEGGSGVGANAYGEAVRVCLVLGSEGQGLSQTALRLCRQVSIPMVGSMESLNVGVAGGILMFALSDGMPSLLRMIEGLGGSASRVPA